MRHWSRLSTRDMLRQNRSVCWWGAVREKRGKKNPITVKKCHLWKKLVKCWFICFSLPEDTAGVANSILMMSFFGFDVGRIRTRPEWFSALLKILRFKSVIFQCAVQLQMCRMYFLLQKGLLSELVSVDVGIFEIHSFQHIMFLSHGLQCYDSVVYAEVSLSVQH